MKFERRHPFSLRAWGIVISVTLLLGKGSIFADVITAKNSDLNRLANFTIPFAKQTLLKRGSFFPFSASVTTSGDVVASSAYTGSETPDPQELIEMTTKVFQNDAKEEHIRATAICSNVTMTLPGQNSSTDAISLELESRSGESVAIYIPYRKGWFGRLKYGEPLTTKVPAKIFASH